MRIPSNASWILNQTFSSKQSPCLEEHPMSNFNGGLQHLLCSSPCPCPSEITNIFLKISSANKKSQTTDLSKKTIF
jgi:hypothetical protein